MWGLRIVIYRHAGRARHYWQQLQVGVPLGSHRESYLLGSLGFGSVEGRRAAAAADGMEDSPACSCERGVLLGNEKIW